MHRQHRRSAYACFVVNIEVSESGLRALSAVCGEQAAIVAGIGSPPSTLSTFDATAAAVRAVHAAVGVASERISMRLDSTGRLVAAARSEYYATDDENRYRIEAVPQGVYEA
jgi:hypothetical protein